jgi:hypothetical protein
MQAGGQTELNRFSPLKDAWHAIQLSWRSTHIVLEKGTQLCLDEFFVFDRGTRFIRTWQSVVAPI